MRTLKVFCTPAERRQLARKYRIIERYDGFALLEASPAAAKELAVRHVVEDVTAELRPPRGDDGRKRLPPGPHHYLVQFVGPIKRAWLTQVKREGGELRAPAGGFTVVVRARVTALARIRALPCVRWVGHLPHRARITPSALLAAGRAPGDLSSTLPRTKLVPGTFTVEFFGAKDLDRARAAVKRLGLRVLASEPSARLLVVAADGERTAVVKTLRALSAVHGVRAVRERVIKRTSNDVAAGIMGTARTLAPTKLGLSGKGEVVAVCDTGLDSGDPKSMHPDFRGRVAWIKSYPITDDWSPEIRNPRGDDGPADFDSGHGTHVAGSVLGSGASSKELPGLARPIRGLAHKAKLVFQAVEQEMRWKDQSAFDDPGRYILSGLPNDLGRLFRDAHAKKARIHSNSWGGGAPGAYDEQCQQLDEFVSRHRDFCVVVAAGNDGTDEDGDGKINPMSVSSPGTAKNCITVGACENHRPAFATARYGDWWPDDYPAAPFRKDPMADDPDHVVAFSSRGPTRDGRTKPDVVAPGTFILSTRSRRIADNNTAWGAFPPSWLYFFMGGTSMATPLTAGAVAVIREYLRKKQKIRRPSAALVKATLIAGATRLPRTARKGTVQDHAQGFGRVNLDAILAPDAPASATFADVQDRLATGQLHETTLEVRSRDVPLRVVLAYTDAPGPRLVNNLNLIVRSPRGRAHVGNHTPGAPLTPDAKNNVEVVHIAKPRAGTWTLQVVASNVPEGRQDFALVCLGHL